MANTTITVQDSTGVALSEATVSYLVNAVTVEGATDTNGELTIAGLEAGTYTFTAALSGYTSASTDVVVTEDADSTGTIALTATITSTIVSAVATAAASTLTEKIAALKVKLNEKIAASHSWAKLGYLVLSALLDTGSEWALNYVASKIK
jgi:uncharacterized surface anchored protein